MSSELSFGAWLKQRRRQADLTQDALAEQAGCSTDMVRKIESGIARPSRQLAELLLTCLQVPPDEQPPLVRWARGDPLSSSSASLANFSPARRDRHGHQDQQLPTGTVTFLFTDVEGSTKLWEHHPQAMQNAISLHDKLLRQTIESNGGYVFKTVGDGFCAAFLTAAEGAQAALAAQRTLHAVPAAEWGEVGPLRVRMALHTGTAELRDGDYFGQPLNRLARLLATGHGGQVLLSLAPQQLVRDHLPPEADLRDLGEGGLRDLVRSEHVYQLVAPDLPRDFPPLKALDTQYIEAALLDGTHISNPYKGLRAFGEADAADFFGRAALIEALLSRMKEPAGNEPSRQPGHYGRFLAVVGPSGSGKSSVVRAGVVPALRQGRLPGSDRWLIAEMLPGNHPLEELEAMLLKLAANPPESLLGQLREDERGLVRAIKRSLPDDETVELLLVVDQFEELFTLVESEAERLHFLNNLHTAVTDRISRLRVIITLRADFYDRPLLYSSFGELVRQRTEVVLPLLPEEMERAIVRPAARAGVTLEAELVAAILQDVGEQPGALPLLQYALTELFERRQGRLLTVGAYRTSGGVLGALGRRAEDIYYGLRAEEQEEARQLFLRLVTLGQETGTQDTRRRAHRAEIASAARDEEALGNVLDLYGRYRMLTFDRDPLTGGPTVEVAHEALLRSWPRLRGWLDTSRDSLKVHRHLIQASSEWQFSGREPSYLASGVRLAQFEAISEEGDLALAREEQEYLAASLERERQHEREEQERRARELTLQKRSASRLRILVVGLAAFLVIASALAAWAANRSEVAQANEQVARTSLVHTQALRLGSEANSLALQYSEDQLVGLLAIRSIETEYTPEGDAALSRAAALAYPIREFRGHKDTLFSVAFSPDGKYILTGSADKTARLWDATTGKQLRAFEGHQDTIYSVAYSPDGKYVATAGADATARIWDPETGRPLHTFSGHQGAIGALAFSQDGKYLLTGSDDHTARLWDIGEGAGMLSPDWGRAVVIFTGHSDVVSGVGFSPDGKHVVTSSLDKTAALWDTATGKQIRIFSGNTGSVNNAAYSPNGKYIATAGGDHTARIWDVTTGDQLFVLTGHTDWINWISFSPDSKYVATVSADKTARLWSVATGQEVRRFIALGNPIQGVAFSSDGNYLLTANAGTENIARIWSVHAPLGEVQLVGHTDPVWQAFFSRDGKRVLTASGDATARIWDAATGQELQRFSETSGQSYGSELFGAVFSPDEKYVLTSSADKTARLWDARSGQQVLTFTGHTDNVNKAAFSPDGKYVVTASYDGTARTWDAHTGQNLAIFKGHTGGHVNRVSFSPDGNRVATSGDDMTARIWEPLTGKELVVLRGHTAIVSGIAFSPDGKYIATGSNDGTARIWDATSGKELKQFVGHSGFVYGVRFSPDGKYLLSSGSDQIARLWDVATGQEQRRFVGHTGTIREVAFSADGRYVLTASHDSTARIWETDYHDAIHYLCAMLTRDLTPEERTQYGIVDQGPTCPAH